METLTQPNLIEPPRALFADLNPKACNKLFEVKTPDGDISDTGVRHLQDYACCQGLPRLPEVFEYVWATRRGTLPKRVQVAYHKAHGLKLTPAQISEFGNIARRHSDTSRTVIMDFTESIDWEDGDFGDCGSCFWGGREGAKDIIEDNGYAVRAYHKLEGGTRLDYKFVKGYARAWIAPIDDNRIIIFNGYGETSLAFARLLSLKFACSYKAISLYNNNSTDGVLYINGSNFILGTQANIEKVAKYDLGWEEPRSEFCHECECDLDDDGITVGAYLYCEDCVGYCDTCSEYVLAGNMRYDNSNYYCSECYGSILERRADEEAEEREREREREEEEERAVLI